MEKEDKHIRGKSIYPDFVAEWCRRNGKDISEIVIKNCRDVHELRGQSFEVIWIDEAIRYNGETFRGIQVRAITRGGVCFVIQPGKINNKKDIRSVWSGMEIQEVDIRE